MEQADRDVILEKIELLVENSNYDLLLKECLDQEIIFPEMVEQFDVDSPHRSLFQKITHRGPKAYNRLLNILKTRFPNAFALLSKVSVSLLFRLYLNRAKLTNDMAQRRIKEIFNLLFSFR